MDLHERRRALAGLVSTQTVVKYDQLMSLLKFDQEVDLENFIISSIYDGCIDGHLDPLNRQFEVIDFGDSIVPDAELSSMLNTLEQWSSYIDQFVGDMKNQVNASDNLLLKRIEEENKLSSEISSKQKEASLHEGSPSTPGPFDGDLPRSDFTKESKRPRMRQNRR